MALRSTHCVELHQHRDRDEDPDRERQRGGETALTDHAGDPEAALLQIAKVEAATQTSLATKAKAVAKGDDTVDSLSSFDLSGAITSASVPDVIQALASAPPREGPVWCQLYLQRRVHRCRDTKLDSISGTITDTVIVPERRYLEEGDRCGQRHHHPARHARCRR